MAARQGEEDVVQRRLAHFDVVHQYPRVVEGPHHDRGQTGRRVHAHAEGAPVLAHRDRARHQRCHGTDRGDVRLGQGHLQAGAATCLLQFERRPLSDDLAVVDDHDVMGQLVGLLQVLRRQQNGDALAQQLADGFPDPQAARRVQPRGGLVEEEHGRAGHQRPGQVQPSPHAARVTLHHPVGRVGQFELGQEFLGPGPGGRPAQVGQLADEHQVLAPGQQRVQRRVLGGDADVAPHFARVPQHVDARHRG